MALQNQNNTTMGYIIEITEDKVENLAEKVGKALRYMGEAMTCIDKMMDDKSNGESMGERGGYRDYRGGYRNPMHESYPDYDEMGERRGMSRRRY